MKKFSKILCIIAVVAVMVSCFVLPSAAASPGSPEILNVESGDTLLPGYYYWLQGIYTPDDIISIDCEFTYEYQGYTYKGDSIVINGEMPCIVYKSDSYEFFVWNDEGWIYPELRLFYIDSCLVTSTEQAEYINLDLCYLGESLEAPGAEPQGWYYNIYDMIVEYVFGGIELTSGMEFSASLIATVISIVAFMLPILICIFLIRFLFAWRC